MALRSKIRTPIASMMALLLVATACGAGDEDAAGDDIAGQVAPGRTPPSVTFTTEVIEHDDLSEFRDPDVPDLPFADNPDPDVCGIPTAWGEGGQAWLTGVWEGELIQPDVLLYDSHQRLSIAGEGPHGAEVAIVLYQSNPVLDYYMVEVVGTNESGWVPAPFLSFEPVVAADA